MLTSIQFTDTNKNLKKVSVIFPLYDGIHQSNSTRLHNCSGKYFKGDNRGIWDTPSVVSFGIFFPWKAYSMTNEKINYHIYPILKETSYAKSEIVLLERTPRLCLHFPLYNMRLVNTFIIVVYGGINYSLLILKVVAFYAKLNEI